MPLMDSTEPLPSTYAKDREAIWRDIRALWQFTRKPKGPNEFTREFIFSYVGKPTNELSPPYKVRETGSWSISRIDLSCRVVGGGPTTIDIFQNGAKIGDLSLPGGQQTIVLDGQVIPVKEGDLIQVQLAAIGGGVLGVVVQMLMR